MEYQKVINLLDDTTNRPSKFRTRDWVEINDESRGAYNNDNDDDENNMMVIILISNLRLQW